MTTEPPPAVAPRPRRTHWRLRILLALNALILSAYIFVCLDRSTAAWLGPVGVGFHDLFNQVPGKRAPLTATGSRFEKDVKALGGHPNVHVLAPGYFGTMGQTEWFSADFQNREFDDAALARLGAAYGDRIGELRLENTKVTDSGLQSLSKFTKLRHLTLRNFPQRVRPGAPMPPPTITDAGLVHLKGLKHLMTLNISDLPITDSGLNALKDLPEVTGLYLSHTKVKGNGLAQWKSLPRIIILYLDGTETSEDGLKVLARATSLQILSLDGVPLSESALPLLKALPSVNNLELTGCGFLDEEIDALVKNKPGLKVRRE